LGSTKAQIINIYRTEFSIQIKKNKKHQKNIIYPTPDGEVTHIIAEYNSMEKISFPLPFVQDKNSELFSAGRPTHIFRLGLSVSPDMCTPHIFNENNKKKALNE